MPHYNIHIYHGVATSKSCKSNGVSCIEVPPTVNNPGLFVRDEQSHKPDGYYTPTTHLLPTHPFSPPQEYLLSYNLVSPW